MSFFSYYGGKSKIAKYYDKPKYDTIIEPFAGAANYSLLYWDKKIILYEKYELLVNLWKYLIQVGENDIMKLPILKTGENIENHTQLLLEEKHLIGFNINQGSAQPKKTAKLYNGWNENKRKNIAENLYKIRHWKIYLEDYLNIDNQEVTYFVDPPYYSGGKWYRYKQIDYQHLANWCKTRNGQVIVCENSKADWLPFKPLKEIRGQKHKSFEVVWCN